MIVTSKLNLVGSQDAKKGSLDFSNRSRSWFTNLTVRVGNQWRRLRTKISYNWAYSYFGSSASF